MKKYVLIFMLTIPFCTLHAMDSEESSSKSTPVLTVLEQTFFKAINGDDLRLFSECLANGVNCNVVNERGITPLQNICSAGKYLLLPLILNASGIDVNKADEDGKTPLHYAAGYWAIQTPIAHVLLMASLIRSGAIINVQDKHGETPLSKLLKLSLQPAILSEFLIDYGADITLTLASPDPLYPIITETIFEQAIRSNNPEQVIAFLKSVKGITKPVVLKALKLAHFGYNKPEWGSTLWAKTPVSVFDNAKMKANFKKMGQILKRYYTTMQGLGFYANAKVKESDWEHNQKNSAPMPKDLAKKIAWHSAKNQPFTLHEQKCLIKLFGAKEVHAC